MTTVQEMMTKRVVSVHRETPLKDVARLLIDNRISGVPVVDVDGAVLGVVSEADFLPKEQGEAAIHHRPLARLFGDSAESRAQQARIVATSAGEAMTCPAETIEARKPVSEAARVMMARGVNRLPVVADGVLVGIISRGDLLRAFIRSDRELEATIRDDVLLHILWLDPAQFDVTVKDGVASIGGRVERRSTADMVERTVAMVPGILHVESDVQWSLDDSKLQPPTKDAYFPFSPL